MQSRYSAVALLIAVLVVPGCGAPQPSAEDGIMDAGAAQAELDAALKEVPLPPGATIHPTIPDPNAGYEVGFGRQAVEGLAMCEWFRFWLAGLAESRPEDVDRATEVAAQFPTWAIYRDADVSYRTVIDGLVDKAKLGDPAAMASFVKASCPTQ